MTSTRLTQLGGGAAINRTSDHDGNDRFPTWAPNSPQIAFWSDREGGGCFVMPALTGAPRKVISTGPLNPSRPQWSSTGADLACIVSAAARPKIEVVSVSTGASKEFSLSGPGPAYWDLGWSPDGRSFAYWTGGGIESDVTELWVSHTSDVKPFKVTEGRTNARGPNWSLDGRSLYYVANTDGGMDLWRQRVGYDGVVGKVSGNGCWSRTHRRGG